MFKGEAKGDLDAMGLNELLFHIFQGKALHKPARIVGKLLQ